MFEVIAPERTLAIVVGIEAYSGGITELPGPANDAVKFVEWLRRRNVPAENIILHLAPLNKNIADCKARLEKGGVPQDWLSADSNEIAYSIINGPKKHTGDLLFLFWGGHGIHSHKYHQTLLLDPKAKKDHLFGLGAKDILEYLEDKHYLGRNYERRMTFIDACDTEFATHGLEKLIPIQDTEYTRRYSPSPESPGIDKIHLAQVHAVHGRPAGQKYDQSGLRQTGYFSSVLLELLEGDEYRMLPPNPNKLVWRIQSELTAMGINQQPRLLTIGEWPHNSHTPIDDYHPGVMERRRHAETASALLNEIGLDRPTLDRCYARALSDENRRLGADTLDQMLVNLYQLGPRKNHGSDRVIEFLYRLNREVKDDRLACWLDDNSTEHARKELRRLLTAEKRKRGEQFNHLLIDIPNNDSEQIKSWFYPNGARSRPKYHGCENKIEGITRTILDLIEEKERTKEKSWIDKLSAIPVLNSFFKPGADGRLFVELYLPFDLLNHQFESYVCHNSERHLGESYPLVVRWRDRAKCDHSGTNYASWKSRTARIRQGNKGGIPQVHWFEESKLETFQVNNVLFECKSISFVGFAFTPEDKLIEAMLKCGVPFAFWRRKDHKDWAAFQTKLKHLADGWDLDFLPHGIKKLRLESLRGPNHHGTALTLLWDDPERNPLGEMLRNDLLIQPRQGTQR